MGAEIGSTDGNAPLNIRGRRALNGVTHELKIASAQIKSSILLAGLGAGGRTTVIEPIPTRDHTERMLRYFGVEIDVAADGRISLDGGQLLFARDLVVPGDISSAAFFLVAAACLAGSDLVLTNIGLNPSRTGIIEVLTRFGVRLSIDNERLECNEPVGDIRVRGGINLPSAAETGRLDGELIANVIDELPVIAVLGTQLPAGLEVRDAAELRVKESDRIASVVSNLRAMGAEVEEFDDGFRVGRSDLTGASVDSFGDHRIAMAFAVAGLMANGKTEIRGADSVDISFPGFFETLANIVI
jgi:3-phosphoshikimate 1-carboxyvinyltransferase